MLPESENRQNRIVKKNGNTNQLGIIDFFVGGFKEENVERRVGGGYDVSMSSPGLVDLDR